MVLNALIKKFGYRIYPYSQLPWGSHLIAAVDHIVDRHKIKTIFDVGANLGQSVLWMNKSFPEARIHSFEPVPDTFRILRKNVSHLPAVKAYSMGVGETNSHLVIQPDSSSPCRSSFQGADSDAGIEVPVKTLDSICQEEKVDCIDLLKIDTEGWEFPVLKGAAGLLSEHRIGMVFVEASLYPERQNQTYLPALMEHFMSHDYVLGGIFDQEFNQEKKRVLFCNAWFLSRTWLTNVN